MQYPQASLPGLPTELRLMILQYALEDTRIDVRRYRKKHENNNKLYNKLKSTIAPTSQTKRSPWSILQINSRIRNEAHQLFFSSSAFHFHDALSSPDFSNFLSTIGASAISHVRTLYFHTRGRCTMFGIEPE
ncbi:putative 2EXR domain-containing protein [Septoria linicola]|nr:putative 2EXR domain-containing protein [Septoria linicola]